MREPTKKIKAYKVFFVNKKHKGELFPPMVANANRCGTPVGVWLQASTGDISNLDGVDIKNFGKRVRVVQGGTGTKGGSGELAFRAGWHLGNKPEAPQFKKRNGMYPEKIVFAECEIAADVDYQFESLEFAMSTSGKFNRNMVTTPFIPYEGFYVYRTNPDPSTPAWFITGAMKVIRLLSDEEVSELTGEDFVREKELVLEDYGLDYNVFEPKYFGDNYERDDAHLLVDFNGYTRRPLDFSNKLVKSNLLEYYCKVNNCADGFDDWYINQKTIEHPVTLKETMVNHPVLNKYYGDKI